MSDVSAREALSYATDAELLKLYAVIVASVLAFYLVAGIATAVGHPIAVIGGFLLSLGAFVAGLAGLVAIAHKLLADA